MKHAASLKAAEVLAANAPPTKSGLRAGRTDTKMRSGRFVGVADGFKASLRSLIDTLQEGELHFIRCLKPNDRKAASTWDRPVACRQLLSAGI